MLIVISPAKTLDYDSAIPSLEHPVAVQSSAKHTCPRLLGQSAELVDILKQKEPWQLSELMRISDDLAVLNANRYQSWQLPFNENTARQALYAFKGDVYNGLDAYSLKETDMQFAQQHLRMLSGLYGVLRPMDLMLPYRLEMGSRLANPRGKDLYHFWGGQITEMLNKDLEDRSSKMLINLASNEYFRAVRRAQLAADIITPVFKDRKGDQYKIISFWAKKARGLMARFIIQNQVQHPDQLTEFNADGYYYSAEHSEAHELVFLRDH